MVDVNIQTYVDQYHMIHMILAGIWHNQM